jgi:hypothetical protein
MYTKKEVGADNIVLANTSDPGEAQLRVPQVKVKNLGVEKDPGSLGFARDDTNKGQRVLRFGSTALAVRSPDYVQARDGVGVA